MSTSATYGARIRFLLAPGMCLNHKAESTRLVLGGIGWKLVPFENAKKIAEAYHLVLSAQGFPTEESAREHGARTKAALSLCGAILRIGIDAGRDTASGGVTDHLRRSVPHATGKQLHNDLHGLNVYPEDPPPVFVCGRAEAVVAKAFSRFEDSLCRAHEAYPLCPRLELALELYARSHFETTSRTRFISLINAIEALANPRERSEKACRVVENLLELVKSAHELDEEDRQAMLGSLGRMRNESIGQACRRLAEECGGKTTYGKMGAAQFFSWCYAVRSKLLHQGDLPESDEALRKSVNELDRMVADLLVAEARVAVPGK